MPTSASVRPAAAPIFGDESFPLGETRSAETWSIGMGGLAVLELLLGPVYVRTTASICELFDSRLTRYEDYIGLEATLTKSISVVIDAACWPSS